MSCLFLWNKDMVCLLSRVNQHCPSPECFVFSIQPAVCYQAITKKLKVCEEVKQILVLMDFYCYEALQFFQSCALYCFYCFPPHLSSPHPTPSGDRIHLHPGSRQHSSQWQHHAYRQKVRSPTHFSHFPFSPSWPTHAASLQPVTENE